MKLIVNIKIYFYEVVLFFTVSQYLQVVVLIIYSVIWYWVFDKILGALIFHYSLQHLGLCQNSHDM